MTIPEGKRIKIYKGERSWLSPDYIRESSNNTYSDYIREVPMYLGEDLNIKTSSEFGSPFQGMQEGAASMGLLAQFASGLLNRTGLTEGRGNDISLQSRFSSYQFWKFSNPITFSLNIKFFKGINGEYRGKTEVYYPSMRLSEITLPTVSSDNFSTLRAPGPNAGNFLDEVTQGTRLEANDYFGSSASQGYQIYVGNTIHLKNCVIKNAEATYSKDVDAEGYPISSTVMLEITSTTVGTTNMIREMISAAESEAIKNKITEDAEEAVDASLSNTIINWASSLLG